MKGSSRSRLLTTEHGRSSLTLPTWLSAQPDTDSLFESLELTRTTLTIRNCSPVAATWSSQTPSSRSSPIPGFQSSHSTGQLPYSQKSPTVKSLELNALDEPSADCRESDGTHRQPGRNQTSRARIQPILDRSTYGLTQQRTQTRPPKLQARSDNIARAQEAATRPERVHINSQMQTLQGDIGMQSGMTLSRFLDEVELLWMKAGPEN